MREKRVKVSEVNNIDLFNNTFSYAPIGMALIGIKGEWLKVNPALLNILGYEEIELLQKTSQDLTYYQDNAIELLYIEKLLRNDIKTYQLKKKLIHKSGQIVSVEVTVSLMREEYGDPLYFIAHIVDITESLKIEKKLQDSEERFRLIAENATDMISKHTVDGTFTFVSPSCHRLFGYDADDVIGKSVFDYFHPEDVVKLENVLKNIIETLDIETVSYRFKHKDGNYTWVETSAHIVKDGSGHTVIAFTRDITERKTEEITLKQDNKMLKTISDTDELTGIPNRRFFEAVYEQQLKQEPSENILAVLLFDIDNFKGINDTFGHLVGDECLKLTATTIQESLQRKNDIVARYGGEEFIVLLPCTDEQGAVTIAERIRKNVEQLNKTNKQIMKSKNHLSISCGIAFASSLHHDKLSTVISKADKALYDAKAIGKNTVRLYREEK
jgi:diguanylate cyclase (GGDEF)-like protein/PAS domain S-box-containing protein